MDLGLKGKVALVAAASQGLGRAVARQLALAGADLCICSRSAASVTAAARELARESGQRVVAVAADVSTAAGVAEVTGTALRELGRVDILVANSGGPRPGSFQSLTDDDWQAAVDLLLLSAVRLTRAVLPGMQEQRWGRVLYITSGTVKVPIQNLILSNSIRAAVTGMARTLANEMGPHGITVNCLAPGRLDTERVRYLDRDTAERSGQTAGAVREGHAGRIPLGRYGDPDEFGRAAAFLCSEAASYISGVTLMVDGAGTNTLL